MGGCPSPDWQVAVEDALDVVAAHVKVGHSVEPAELDRRYVVRLRCLLLCTCGAETVRMDQILSTIAVTLVPMDQLSTCKVSPVGA